MTYALPPLNALRAFEAAARHLSFKLAAHELHVTPAAVGQQVKALEARLGVRLFERLHKQLILTAAGQAYLPEISDGFRRIADATSQLKPAGAVLLQLGVHASFDLRRLDLAAFRSAHADIGLRVLQPAGLHELVEGKVDLLIARGLGRHPGFCNGPWLVNPFCASSSRRVLASVRGQRDGRHLMGCIGGAGRPIYGSVVVSRLPGWRPDRIHRPGEGTSLREGLVSWPARNPIDAPRYPAR
jgi:LysR family transcriptional regulator, glycine cleavage system transcriptional activator